MCKEPKLGPWTDFIHNAGLKSLTEFQSLSGHLGHKYCIITGYNYWYKF